ncbi:leucine zipper protein 4 isoform X2 [Fukomys damarensis]|nr:leucine zipper protein 4 isoform X2 [Fukomys damarensis]
MPGASGEQSNAHKDHWKRGDERNAEETMEDNSLSESEQSPPNQEPLKEQEKYNVGYKAQSEAKEHQPKGNQDNLERSHGQSKRSRSKSERSHDHSKRSHGSSERSHAHSERYHGRSERSHAHSERYHGHSGRSHGRSGRSHHHSRRSPDQSERSYRKSERYRRHFPGGGFKTSFESDSQFDGDFSIKRKNDYFYEKKLQKNDPLEMHRVITPEDEHNSYETERSYTRHVSRGQEILFLKNRYTGEGSLYQPKGVYLNFNFQALGNQTKLSLNARFSKLRFMRKPVSFNS